MAAAALYTGAAVQIDNVHNSEGFSSASYERLLVARRRQILSFHIMITWCQVVVLPSDNVLTVGDLDERICVL